MGVVVEDRRAGGRAAGRAGAGLDGRGAGARVGSRRARRRAVRRRRVVGGGARGERGDEEQGALDIETSDANVDAQDRGRSGSTPDAQIDFARPAFAVGMTTEPGPPAIDRRRYLRRFLAALAVGLAVVPLTRELDRDDESHRVCRAAEPNQVEPAPAPPLRSRCADSALVETLVRRCLDAGEWSNLAPIDAEVVASRVRAGIPTWEDQGLCWFPIDDDGQPGYPSGIYGSAPLEPGPGKLRCGGGIMN
ncbi:MAG: hypothetical protein R2939_13965 [Kofleriaceae bacterium]